MGLMCDSRARDSIHTKPQPSHALLCPSPHLLPYPALGSGTFHISLSSASLLLPHPNTTWLDLSVTSGTLNYTDQPCSKTRGLTSCIIPGLEQNVLALQPWGCCLGFQHKWARQLHQHQTQGFLTFPMPLLLDFSHHAPSFLSARKEDPWAASQQIYSANRAPSAVCDCLKLQENTTTTIKTEGNPSSSSSRLHQLTLHDILTHHFAAHCLI